MGKETISRTTLVKGVTACVVVAASLGIIQIGEYSVNSGTSVENTAATATENTGTAIYTPGTYTASAAGISSDVTVSCTFDESSITAMTIDVSGETAGIGADIGDEMIEQFLAAQGSSVDGVSGATITSDALKTALDDCISQATGGSGSSDDGEASDTAKETESETPVEDTAETEAETMNDDTAETEAETAAEDTAETEAETTARDIAETESEAAAEDAAEAESETAATEAAETETEAAGEASASAGGQYTPGTYTATAAGIDSDVSVTITVDENSILSIGCDVSGETAGIGADIGPEISSQILNAQSADVDGISGATVTSDAVKTAVEDALAQASGSGAVAASSEAVETAESEAENAETETEAAETEAVETESEAAETETEDAETEAVETESEAADTETEAVETESEATETETEDAETEANEIEDAETEAATDGVLFAPGVYTASAEGISSEVSVTIVTDETTIISIGYDLSGETADIGGAIGPEITSNILEAQSSEVDGVSGATVTSEAFKAAVAACIAQAKSAAAVSDMEDSTEAETFLEETDAEDASGDADSDSVYTPGTYTSSAEGISSEITVTMTFDENSILEMDADVSGETAGIGAIIDEDVINQVLTAQSVDVDGISGATVTSSAILEAAADCIAQAQSDGSATVIGESDGPTSIFVAGEDD